MATHFMDTDEVRRMADGFSNGSEILKGVATALEAAMMLLKATAFVGLVGGAVLERFLAYIKPRVEEMAAKFEELSNDLKTAALLYEQAAESGDSL